MSKLAHSNQETMDEIERRSEIEGDYIASIEGPHEDKPPVRPSLEELDKCIAINEAFKARKNADVTINPDRATDIELYCLYAVRDGVEKGARKRSPYWTCCECDAPLSCAVCGVEQPDDSKYFEGQARDAAQSPWMDIETAPKDGTIIIGRGPWRFGGDKEFVALAIRYNSDLGIWQRDNDGYGYTVQCHPTFWMPIPAPPTHNSPSVFQNGIGGGQSASDAMRKLSCPTLDHSDSKASHNHGEGDPSVTPDYSGGDQ